MLYAIIEHDEPLLALGVDLRDGQVFLVVLGELHVDEVGSGPRVDAGRVEAGLVGAVFWREFAP